MTCSDRRREECSSSISNPALQGPLRLGPKPPKGSSRKRDNDQWKDSIVIFAHTTGYLSTLAVTGHPPPHTSDGDEFAAPERGLFLLTHPERPAYYRQGSEAGIMWALAQYAWATGNREASAKWLTGASEAVSSARITYLHATIAKDLIPSLLLSDQYEQAVDAGIKACQALQIFQRSSPTEKDPFAELDLDAAGAGMSPEQRTHVETCALIFAVLPAFMRIGVLATDDRERARWAGRSLAAVCRQVSDNAHNPRLWSGVAEILEFSSQDRATARDLNDLSQTFNGDMYTPLRGLGYLASSLHGSVDEAFSAQLAIMEVLFAWYPPESPTHYQLLLPFVERFWTMAFSESRFQFRSPSLVEAELAQAIHALPSKRVRAILRAVRLGVSVRGFDQALRWLESDAS